MMSSIAPGWIHIKLNQFSTKNHLYNELYIAPGWIHIKFEQFSITHRLRYLEHIRNLTYILNSMALLITVCENIRKVMVYSHYLNIVLKKHT